MPYQYTWSCYEGGEKPCGVCGTCRDRAEAFRLNKIEDPALIKTEEKTGINLNACQSRNYVSTENETANIHCGEQTYIKKIYVN